MRLCPAFYTVRPAMQSEVRFALPASALGVFLRQCMQQGFGMCPGVPLLAQVSAKAQCHGQLAVGSPLQLLKGAQTHIWHGNSSRQA